MPKLLFHLLLISLNQLAGYCVPLDVLNATSTAKGFPSNKNAIVIYYLALAYLKGDSANAK